MPYAVVFYFDPQKSAPLERVTHELARTKVAPYLHSAEIPPHVTLAIYDDLDCQPCEKKIAGLAKETRGFDLNFVYLGLFRNESKVVFLGATVTLELLSYHQQIHNLLKKDAEHPWELYQPGKWVPHCTLATDFSEDKTMQVIRLCGKLQLPIDIRVASMGVVQFEPITPLYSYHFTST
ncbi:MAG: 2'-5' RNA ligase family protein [Chloroflexi bacterium]|nr:2'-5' RNA ligase family protein [Chloroflexota bacterium]